MYMYQVMYSMFCPLVRKRLVNFIKIVLFGKRNWAILPTTSQKKNIKIIHYLARISQLPDISYVLPHWTAQSNSWLQSQEHHSKHPGWPLSLYGSTYMSSYFRLAAILAPVYGFCLPSHIDICPSKYIWPLFSTITDLYRYMYLNRRYNVHVHHW